jgi:hypothetical protein
MILLTSFLIMEIFEMALFSTFVLWLIAGWEQSRSCNNMMMNSTTFYMASSSYREVIFTHVPNISVRCATQAQLYTWGPIPLIPTNSKAGGETFDRRNATKREETVLRPQPGSMAHPVEEEIDQAC